MVEKSELTPLASYTQLHIWSVTGPAFTRSNQEKGIFYDHREYMQCFPQNKVAKTYPLKYSKPRNPTISRRSVFSDKSLSVT